MNQADADWLDRLLGQAPLPKLLLASPLLAYFLTDLLCDTLSGWTFRYTR